MEAGRPPKPTELKILAGNPGGRKLHEDILPPSPADVEPLTPPVEMTDSQKAIWNDAIENAPKGLLRRLDRGLFTSWVLAVDEINTAQRHIQSEGLIVKEGGGERETIKPDGTKTITRRSDSWTYSPWADARDKAFQRMVRAIGELGFSPVSRARITLAGATGKEKQNRFTANAAKRA